MRIGALNKRITLQYPTRVPDGMGGFTESYSDSVTVYAAIWAATAREENTQDTMTMVVTHRIRIRYRSAVKQNWRVKYGNRYFSIEGITNPNEANKQLDLLCREAQ